MKVGEIIREGFVSSFAKNLVPKIMQPVISKSGGITAQQTAGAKAAKLYAPGGEDDWRGDKEPAPTPPAPPPAPPSPVSPLHPDVQVVNPVPAILRYRGRDYEFNEYTKEWNILGSKKKAGAALDSFLNKELAKL